MGIFIFKTFIGLVIFCYLEINFKPFERVVLLLKNTFDVSLLKITDQSNKLNILLRVRLGL